MLLASPSFPRLPDAVRKAVVPLFYQADTVSGMPACAGMTARAWAIAIRMISESCLSHSLLFANAFGLTVIPSPACAGSPIIIVISSCAPGDLHQKQLTARREIPCRLIEKWQEFSRHS